MTPFEFERRVLPLKDRLYRFALSYMGQPADAQDVVQDVLLKAWERLQQQQDIHNIEAWCMTLTKNRALDKLRRHGRHYEVVAENLQLPSQEADPLRRTVALDTLDCLQRFIATLPANQRAVVQLRDVEQYSYQEIADLLDMKLSQVKVLLHRARTRIRQSILQAQHHDLSNP